LLNADWFSSTRFYLDGNALTIEELDAIGIIAPGLGAGENE
jgi:hypothetical protein